MVRLNRFGSKFFDSARGISMRYLSVLLSLIVLTFTPISGQPTLHSAASKRE